MAWDTSTRRAELPPNWPAIRQAVIERDGGLCQLCGLPGNDVDHMGDKHDHRLAVLRLLCSACHLTRTLAQANAARPRERRPAERHPGLR